MIRIQLLQTELQESNKLMSLCLPTNTDISPILIESNCICLKILQSSLQLILGFLLLFSRSRKQYVIQN